MKEMFGWFSKKEEKTIQKTEKDATFGLMRIVHHLQDVKNLGVTQSSLEKLVQLKATLSARMQDVRNSEKDADSIKPLFSSELIREIAEVNNALAISTGYWSSLDLSAKTIQLHHLELRVLANDSFYCVVRNFLGSVVKAFDPEYQGGADNNLDKVFNELEFINLKLSQIKLKEEGALQMVQEDLKFILSKCPIEIRPFEDYLISHQLIRVVKALQLKPNLQFLLQKTQQLHIKIEFMEHVVGEKMIAQADHYQDAVFIKYASAELLEALKQAEYDAAKRLEKERAEVEAERVAIVNAAKLKEEHEVEAERVAIVNAAKLRLNAAKLKREHEAIVDQELRLELNSKRLELSKLDTEIERLKSEKLEFPSVSITYPREDKLSGLQMLREIYSNIIARTEKAKRKLQNSDIQQEKRALEEKALLEIKELLKKRQELSIRYGKLAEKFETLRDSQIRKDLKIAIIRQEGEKNEEKLHKIKQEVSRLKKLIKEMDNAEYEQALIGRERILVSEAIRRVAQKIITCFDAREMKLQEALEQEQRDTHDALLEVQNLNKQRVVLSEQLDSAKERLLQLEGDKNRSTSEIISEESKSVFELYCLSQENTEGDVKEQLERELGLVGENKLDTIEKQREQEAKELQQKIVSINDKKELLTQTIELIKKKIGLRYNEETRQEQERAEKEAKCYKNFELKLQELRFKLREIETEKKNLLNSTAEAQQRLSQMKRDMDALTSEGGDVVQKLWQDKEGVKKEELKQKLEKIKNQRTELQKTIESEERDVGQLDKSTTQKIAQLQKAINRIERNIAFREERDELRYNEDALLRQERKERQEEDVEREENERAIHLAAKESIELQEEKREKEEENEKVEKEVEPAEQEEKQERKEQEPQVNGTFMATVAAEVLINNGTYVQGEYFCQAELVSNGLPGVHEIEQPSDLSEI